ncbi:hypothetical protein [Parahaliea aestuarii]|uniref:Glycosyltransferase RgtA/B/C/D-like domain-containing protein n=1 Tax=Parahaliea aestuarii TaxID=1852021 RepID=A0A5C9A346_9GAMM|nr:hypothetical protein [Parahaliea aestuarii]TXS94424.1 hypothetical protein FVW59_00435 [Parahaliea aestuarii]
MDADIRREWRLPLALLLCIFLLGLLPRLYSAALLGWGWDGPGTFNLVNFDEGGSCRAALGGFKYSTFIGRQTIAIAGLLGAGPPPGIAGDAAAVAAYCHGAEHIRGARIFSAVTGALTPVVLALLAFCLLPAQPAVGLTAGALLALSGFHISESHSGTVDAPSVFFIYFLLLGAVAASTRWRRALWALPPLLTAAVWAKYWVFALLTLAAALPATVGEFVARGWSRWRFCLAVLTVVIAFGCLSNSDFPLGAWPLLALGYLAVPWRRIAPGMIPLWLAAPFLGFALLQIEVVASYTMGAMEGRFGSSYAAIGWHKWLRNALNIPLVLTVGLGLPAALCIPLGVRSLLRSGPPWRPWLCLLPLVVFLLFMLVPAPVTYYRHYLALIPAAALLAAMGFWTLPRRWARVGLPLFLAWPALLAWDLVADYHRDPRIELRHWYQQARPERLLFSYYVQPPRLPEVAQGLFRESFARDGGAVLRQGQYLLLSENWYDTAFANELNGPLIGDLQRLVKTTPFNAQFYRQALAGEVDYLRQERVIAVNNFMPELVLHKHWYGTFQLFVGDIHIFRILQ